VDVGEGARGDLVGAYGAADGVVVQVYAGVLLDVVAPDIATCRGVVVLCFSARFIQWWRKTYVWLHPANWWS
jgi:hypothetical protein